MKSIRLADIAEKLDAQLHGDGDILISSMASMLQAEAGQITFLASSQYRSVLEQVRGSAVILTEADLAYCKVPALVVKNPYLSYAIVAQMLDDTPEPANNIASTAVIGQNVVLGQEISIGHHTVIEDGVILGDNVCIGAGCFIGKQAKIDANTKIWANVSIYHNVQIGKNCLIQANTVIGADGFGYANDRGKWLKIPQVGSVRVGDNVEIGACTTIDRGALDDTIIGNGVIIDNQCQIAHNVMIGEHTAIAGGVIMAGSLKVGRYCMIGGASVINGHITICDKVNITGMSMVIRSISEPGTYSSGIPLQENKKWRKTAALVLRIDDIQHRLKSVEQKLKK